MPSGFLLLSLVVDHPGPSHLLLLLERCQVQAAVDQIRGMHRSISVRMMPSEVEVKIVAGTLIAE